MNKQNCLSIHYKARFVPRPMSTLCSYHNVSLFSRWFMSGEMRQFGSRLTLDQWRPTKPRDGWIIANVAERRHRQRPLLNANDSRSSSCYACILQPTLCLSVSQSVCLSVTLVYCVEMAYRAVKWLSPSSFLIILVHWYCHTKTFAGHFRKSCVVRFAEIATRILKVAPDFCQLCCHVGVIT